MDVETRQLQQRLQAAQQLPEVLMLKPTTASTNDDVREIAQKGIQSALVCSAQQTQGRGQRQRQWVSPEGNVYLSTLLNTRTAIDGRLALEVALNKHIAKYSNSNRWAFGLRSCLEYSTYA